MDGIATRKRALRRDIRSRLETLSGPELQEKSRRIAEHLLATPWWQRARWVFAYIAMPAEVETRDIIVRAYLDHKEVAIPRMEGDELVFYRYDGKVDGLLPNQFGILEPDPSWLVLDPCRLDGGGDENGRADTAGETAAGADRGALLVLAPGMAFDANRRRLGRGKGYYDRLLSAARCSGVDLAVVGLAYEEQLVDEIPVHDHDQPLDGVVTDRQVIR